MMQKKNSFLMSYAVACLLSLFLVACKTAQPIKTIIPPRVENVEKSWDGNTQDSGIKGIVLGKGFEVSEKALARYQALVAIYGGQSIPRISADDGILTEGGKIFMSNEAMVNFVVLSDKFRNGKQ